MAERAEIVVRGIVQGVGFRPFVFNLAESLRLKGYVVNTSDGVCIDVEGSALSEFISRLRIEAPPLSHITDLVVTKFPFQGYSDFTIRHSRQLSSNLPFTLVSPDVSVCGDCLKELLDPSDRHFLYPFINCTNCGPRYSITRSVPYDRSNTTMAAFAMCDECAKEYKDPGNRRFHAQPNACPNCGPVPEFRTRAAEPGVKRDGAIARAIELLKQGGILAVKGLGGFHIACDALNDAAVKRLRGQKRRNNKPFAVMAPTVETIERFCMVSGDEKRILESGRRPVVLLSKKTENGLSGAVSPNNRCLGVMLPYTPLHYLLFYQPANDGKTTVPHFSALVMTSGNLSEEPIVRDNDEAMRKLANIVDGFLFHDRDIFMRVDDSVLRVRSSQQEAFKSSPAFIRRSRGYAPDPIELNGDGPEVLACGADLKNTFTITKGRFAIPSQHIGDMENYETVKFFEESLANLKAVYRSEPAIVVHDLHPGYLSTRWACESGMKTAGVQHHYAHIGSVMAEHGLSGKVIGVAFDGTGYGTDGNLWGGEFLLADIEGFERAGQFKYMKLPGGEAAIRDPWRTAVSLALAAEGDKARDSLLALGFLERHGKEQVEQVMKVCVAPELSPLSSGTGRLFDAVSALIGACDRNTFEGEAAIALEALLLPDSEEEYPVELSIHNGYTQVVFDAMIRNIISDRIRSVSPQVVATRFHNTIASVIRNVVLDLKKRSTINTVCLSGGTFQNIYLLNRAVKMLSSAGMNVFTNHKVPCNDGGISLGQAHLIRERLKKKNNPLPIGEKGPAIVHEANAR